MNTMDSVVNGNNFLKKKKKEEEQVTTPVVQEEEQQPAATAAPTPVRKEPTAVPTVKPTETPSPTPTVTTPKTRKSVTLTAEQFRRYAAADKYYSKNGQTPDDYYSWAKDDEILAYNDIKNKRGKYTKNKDGSYYYMTDSEYAKYGREYSSYSSTGKVSDGYYSWAVDDDIIAYNAIHNSGNYATDDWSYGLDDEIVSRVADEYKSQWGSKYYYDTTDADDMARQAAGEMPKYAISKYNMKNPYDKWLYEHNLPPSSAFSDMYSQAVVDYNEEVEENNKKWEGYNTTYQGVIGNMNSAYEEMPALVEALNNGSTWEEIVNSGKYPHALALYVSPKKAKDYTDVDGPMPYMDDGSSVFDYSGKNKDLYESAYTAIMSGETPDEEFFEKYDETSWNKFLISKIGWNEEDVSRWYEPTEDGSTPNLKVQKNYGILASHDANEANAGKLQLTAGTIPATAEELNAKGWKIRDGNYTAYNPQVYSDEDGVSTVIATVYNDATTGKTVILTPDEAQEYADEYLETGEDPLGIVIADYETKAEARDGKEEIESALASVYGYEDPEAYEANLAAQEEKEAQAEAEHREKVIAEDTTGVAAPYYEVKDAYTAMTEAEEYYESHKKDKEAKAAYEAAKAAYDEKNAAFNAAYRKNKATVLAQLDPEQLEEFVGAYQEYNDAVTEETKAKKALEGGFLGISFTSKEKRMAEAAAATNRRKEAEEKLKGFSEFIFDFNPFDESSDGYLSQVDAEYAIGLIRATELEQLGSTVELPEYSGSINKENYKSDGSAETAANEIKLLYFSSYIANVLNGESEQFLKNQVDLTNHLFGKSDIGTVIAKTVSGMTENQMKGFLYLTSTGRVEEAIDYALSLMAATEYDIIQDNKEYWSKYAEEHPVLSFIESTNTITQLGKAGEGIGNLITGALSGENVSMVDQMYSSPFTMMDTTMTSTMQGNASSGFTSWLFSTGKSIAENVARIPLAVVGGETLTLGTMGAEVFNQALISAYENNKSPDRAYQDALFTAGVEIATESISLGSFLNSWKAGTTSWLSIIKQGLIEGGEEATASILDAAYEYYRNGDLDDSYGAEATAWLAEHPDFGGEASDADKLEWVEWLLCLKDLGLETAAGVLSGGIFGGAAYTKTAISVGGFKNLSAINGAMKQIGTMSAEQHAAVDGYIAQMNVDENTKTQMRTFVNDIFSDPLTIFLPQYSEILDAASGVVSESMAANAIEALNAAGIADGSTTIDIQAVMSNPAVQQAAQEAGVANSTMMKFLEQEQVQSGIEAAEEAKARYKVDSKVKTAIQTAQEIRNKVIAARKSGNANAVTEVVNQYKSAVDNAFSANQEAEVENQVIESRNKANQTARKGKLQDYMQKHAETYGNLKSALKSAVATATANGEGIGTKTTFKARDMLSEALEQYKAKEDITEEEKAEVDSILEALNNGAMPSVDLVSKYVGKDLVKQYKSLLKKSSTDATMNKGLSDKVNERLKANETTSRNQTENSEGQETAGDLAEERGSVSEGNVKSQTLTESEAEQKGKQLEETFKKELGAEGKVTVITNESQLSTEQQNLLNNVRQVFPSLTFYMYEAENKGAAAGLNDGSGAIGINVNQGEYSMAHTIGHEIFETILRSKSGIAFKNAFDSIGISQNVKDAYLNFFKTVKLAEANAETKARYTNDAIMNEFIQDLGGIWAANMLNYDGSETNFADYGLTIFSTDQFRDIIGNTLNGTSAQIGDAVSSLMDSTQQLNDLFLNTWLDNLNSDLSVAEKNGMNTESETSDDAPLTQEEFDAIPEAGDSGFNLNSPTERAKDLIATHCLSQENLLKAIRSGLFMMPSTAIKKINSSYHNEEYAECTAVFNADAINPEKNKQSHIHAGDIWSPTMSHAPEIEDGKIKTGKILGLIDKYKKATPENIVKAVYDKFGGRVQAALLMDVNRFGSENYQHWQAFLSKRLTTMDEVIEKGDATGEDYRDTASGANSAIKSGNHALYSAALDMFESDGRKHHYTQEEIDELGYDEVNKRQLAEIEELESMYKVPIHQALIEYSNGKGSFRELLTKNLKQNFKFDNSSNKFVDDSVNEAIDKLDKGKQLAEDSILNWGFLEAKIKGTLGLDALAGVVIPDNASDELRKALIENGIPFKEYKAGDMQDRIAKSNQLVSETQSGFSISSGMENDEYVKLRKGVSKTFEQNLFEQNQDLFHTTDNGMFRRICTDARTKQLKPFYDYKGGKLYIDSDGASFYTRKKRIVLNGRNRTNKQTSFGNGTETTGYNGRSRLHGRGDGNIVGAVLRTGYNGRNSQQNTSGKTTSQREQNQNDNAGHRASNNQENESRREQALSGGTENGAVSLSSDSAGFSLKAVEPIIPKNGWIRSLTTEEARNLFPKLYNVRNEDSGEGDSTQIPRTVNTYRHIYDLLKRNGFSGKILDASSGLGLGTKAGREEYGFDVEDIEPYYNSDRYYGDGSKPNHTDYSSLNKKYDTIISSFVLNVLPQDSRDAMVVKLGSLLKNGGTLFVMTRGKDVEQLKYNPKNVVFNEEKMEYGVDSSGAYQKGFTPQELKAYLQDALGSDYTVTIDKKISPVTCIVTKDKNIVGHSLTSGINPNSLTRNKTTGQYEIMGRNLNDISKEQVQKGRAMHHTLDGGGMSDKARIRGQGYLWIMLRVL